MKRYSQNNEQDIILDFFGGRVCSFLDIGASDGIFLSNTRALAELGWLGLMVEPSPICAVSLLNNIEQFNKRVSVLLCAVSGTTGIAQLSLSGDKSKEWANSIEPTFPDDWIPDKRNISVLIPTVSIKDILLSYGPFQFISIDAEWKDFEILINAPQGLPGCELLCIESAGAESRSNMIQYLKDHHQFEVYYETNENIIAKSQRIEGR